MSGNKTSEHSVCDGVRDCWFQHEATAHTANTAAALLEEFFGSALWGVAFGPNDLQTSLRQTYFYVDFPKKGFIRITHKAWKK